MIKKKAARTAFYPAHGIEMNITGEIGRKIKTLFAYFTDKRYRFHGPVYMYSNGQACRIFPLIANGMAKEKRKGENCLGML